jgi:DNA-directed RNA polymerase subunit RPC12/RpoP
MISVPLIEPGDLSEEQPASKYPLQRRLMARFLHALQGGWYCLDCARATERDEGEQGQPAHCHYCKSHRIEYHRPAS